MNVIDTCAIWNILSSQKFLSLAKQAGCSFLYTRFVLYECLYKPRTEFNQRDNELQERLKRLIAQKGIAEFSLDIEDLQDIEVLQQRENLGKGELSSIVLAKKFGRSFQTDDQGARKLSKVFLEDESIQTTPQLFGWLAYISYISDTDKDEIIKEHKYFNRPLEKFFHEVYKYALQFRLEDYQKSRQEVATTKD